MYNNILFLFLLLFVNTLCDSTISQQNTNDYGIFMLSTNRTNFIVSDKTQRVFMYTLQESWQLSYTITDHVYDEDGKFGECVDILNNNMIISAHGKQRVYIYKFQNQNWSFTQMFYPAVQYMDAEFGKKVKFVNEGIFLLSHPKSKVFTEDNVGSIEMYVFIGYVWDKAQTILPSDYNQDDGFAHDFDYISNTLIVSSIGRNKVYIYELNQQSMIFIETNSIQNNNDEGYGNIVRVSENHIFVSSYNKLFIYTKYNTNLVQTIASTHEIKKVFLQNNSNYFSMTTDTGQTFLYKFMQNTYFGIVDTFENTPKTQLSNDFLSYNINQNTIYLHDSFNYTNAPTPSPTIFPSKSPTIPQSEIISEDVYMTNIVLAASILIPIMIFIIGLKFGKIC